MSSMIQTSYTVSIQTTNKIIETIHGIIKHVHIIRLQITGYTFVIAPSHARWPRLIEFRNNPSLRSRLSPLQTDGTFNAGKSIKWYKSRRSLAMTTWRAEYILYVNCHDTIRHHAHGALPVMPHDVGTVAIIMYMYSPVDFANNKRSASTGSTRTHTHQLRNCTKSLTCHLQYGKIHRNRPKGNAVTLCLHCMLILGHGTQSTFKNSSPCFWTPSPHSIYRDVYASISHESSFKLVRTLDGTLIDWIKPNIHTP